jgi:hypothetical protein
VATLHLVRPNDYAGRYRSLKVLVDGQQAAALKPNQRVSIVVGDGAHEAVGKMDWMRSRPTSFDIAGSEDVTVELSIPFGSIFDAVFRPRRAIRARMVS